MQDREPTYPGRVTLTPVYGLANTYDMERADRPLQQGTPLNKASLLKDATAALYGLGTGAVPDDVLSKLSKGVLAQTAGKYTKHIGTLGEYPVGNIIQLNENGTPVDFYVSKHDYESDLNGTGRTLVVRKDCYDSRQWNSSAVNAYASSDIDSWLNSTYKNLLNADIREAIGTTKFKSTPGNGNTTVGTLERAIFLLSAAELNAGLNFAAGEGTALSIAGALKISNMDGRPVDQWTRSPYTVSNSNAVYLSSSGVGYGDTCTASKGSRPIFTLPATMALTWYTDSSGNIYTEQEYETKITDVLGNLISIPADQIKDGVKIATGSYTGTGTHGASNPNSLTFDFEPKVLFIAPVTNYSGALNYQSIFWKGVTSFPTYIGSADTGMSVVVNWGKTVSWYTTGSYANRQLNDSGVNYAYVAIG